MSQKAIAKVLEAEREADAIRENAAATARAKRETVEAEEMRRRDETVAAERSATRARETEVRARAEALIARSRSGRPSIDASLTPSSASSSFREASWVR